MYNIEKKVALVTGGGKGIGRAYCTALVKDGAKVLIADTDEVSGKELETMLNVHNSTKCCHFVKSNVSSKGELKACFDLAIKTFGQLDIIINNAGMLDETENGWKLTLELNLVAVIESTRLAIDEYLKPGGVIVNTSSIAADRDTTFPIYAASKAGVTIFTRSIGGPRPFRATGVRVMAIQPGLTHTRLASSEVFNRAWIPNNKPNETLEDRHPSQKPEAVAECLIDILRHGESGSIWNVIAGKWKEDVHQEKHYKRLS